MEEREGEGKGGVTEGSGVKRRGNCSIIPVNHCITRSLGLNGTDGMLPHLAASRGVQATEETEPPPEPSDPQAWAAAPGTDQRGAAAAVAVAAAGAPSCGESLPQQPGDSQGTRPQGSRKTPIGDGSTSSATPRPPPPPSLMMLLARNVGVSSPAPEPWRHQSGTSSDRCRAN